MCADKSNYYAERIHSSAFLADAWHHRSDAFSSIGSLIGIGGAMLGFPVMDSVASVVHVDSLRSRMFGNKVFIDLKIQVDGEKSLRNAHEVAGHVCNEMEHTFPAVKYIMIHLNPAHVPG